MIDLGDLARRRPRTAAVIHLLATVMAMSGLVYTLVASEVGVKSEPGATRTRQQDPAAFWITAAFAAGFVVLNLVFCLRAARRRM